MSSQINTNNNQNYPVQIRVWDAPKSGGPGHVGITYTKESGEEGYHAVWPKGLLGGLSGSLFGYLFGFASESQIVQSFKKDCETEERDPDRSVEVFVKQTTNQKITEYFNRRKKESDNGTHLYCLAPGFALFSNFVQTIASSYPTGLASEMDISLARGDQLPIDEDEKKVEEGFKEIVLGHCANEAENIINIIREEQGKPPVSPYTILPHRFTPGDIGDLAQELEGARVVRSLQKTESGPSQFPE